MKRKTAGKAGQSRTMKRRTAAPRRKAAAVPATPPDAIDAMVAAGAQALKMPLDPAWHGGVKFNLQLIFRMAALVDEFALPDDTEPAPVFHA